MNALGRISRTLFAVLAILALFGVGFKLLSHVPDYQPMKETLEATGETMLHERITGYGPEAFAAHREWLAQYRDLKSGATGLTILRRFLAWDYCFLFTYLIVGCALSLCVTLSNELQTTVYRKNVRLFLVLIAISDLFENSLLLWLTSARYEASPVIAATFVSIASVATIVKMYSAGMLVLVFIALVIYTFRREEPATPIRVPRIAPLPNRTPKNIVLFSDGTGNASAKDRGTNVFKLFEALDLADPFPTQARQIAFYDDGVGTEGNKLLRTIGGAFGVGLSQNVKDLYAELARNYEPGDRIYLFGFSRGAFTVRTLAGMIANCGILKDNSSVDSRVEELYYYYRKRYPTALKTWMQNLFNMKVDSAAELKAWTDQNSYPIPDLANGEAPLIEFVGVWDTVDAYGLPWDGLSMLIDKTLHKFTFPDNTLNKQVARARHAMAIDDERDSFHPVLWDEKDETRIQQVWFPGVHSNVGGGYPRQGLSLISLNWMMDEAASGNGLRFIQSKVEEYKSGANDYAHLYNSREGFSIYYYYNPRDIMKMCATRNMTPKVHISAIRRIAYASECYSPGNLPTNLTVVGSLGKTYPKESKIINDHFSGANLLDHKRRTIALRQFSQYAFWGVTTAGVIYLAVSEATLQETFERFGLIATVIVALLGISKAFNILPIIPELFTFLPRRMKRDFAAQWAPLRERLK